MAEEKSPEREKNLDPNAASPEENIVDVSFDEDDSVESEELTPIPDEEVEPPIPEEWRGKPESEIALLREIQDLQTQLKTKEAAWFDKYARLQAEFDNFRKRSVKEQDSFRNYASAELIAKILPVLDGSDNMLKSLAQKLEPEEYKGVEMFLRQLMGVLEKEGLTPIKAEGVKFDPFVHEVLTTKQTDECPEDIVVAVFQKGYQFKDRVLRPSKVVISKKLCKEEPDSKKEEETSEESGS
jgi:molecular chaperone GrpE